MTDLDDQRKQKQEEEKMGDSKIVEKFTIFASKLGNEIHLRSLRDAFATIMPLYILAGLAVLINNTVFQWVLSHFLCS